MKFDCPSCFSLKNIAAERNQFVRDYEQRNVIPPNRFRELAKVLFGKPYGNTVIYNPGFEQYTRKHNNIERKHKVKKRDVVKSSQRGKFNISAVSGTDIFFRIVQIKLF